MARDGVRRIETDDHKAALYAFRYRIYIEEFGLTGEADHERKWLRDDYDDHSVNYGLFVDDEIVGALRCIFPAGLDDPAPLIEKFAMAPAIDSLGIGAVATTGRFMIAPRLRNTGAIFRLVRDAYRDSIGTGVRLNYGDCSPHLLPLYEQLGYRRYTDGFNDTAFGFKVPILMPVRDREYLERVRSPLARLVREEDDDPEIRAWFAATYPEYVDLISAGFMQEDLFFDLLAERVASDPQHAIALLHGLDRDQVGRFLARATVIKVQPGDRIVRQGDRDNTLYALLSGAAEVRLDGATGPPLAVFAQGDTFGEIGYLTKVPRTANVIARTPGEVLVISGDFADRLVEEEPEIGARVMGNLSRELAGRLAVASHRDSAGP